MSECFSSHRDFINLELVQLGSERRAYLEGGQRKVQLLAGEEVLSYILLVAEISDISLGVVGY